MRHEVIAPRDPGRIAGWPGRVIWFVVVVMLLLSIACAGLIPDEPAMPTWALLVFTLLAGSLGVMGALIATRQPRNAVGWILWIASVAIAMSSITSMYVNHALTTDQASAPGTVFIAWLSQIGFFPALVSVVIFMPLLFPDGRYLGRRWRWVGVYGVAVVGTILAGAMFTPGPMDAYPTITNPVGLEAFHVVGPLVAFANGPAVLLTAAGLGTVSAVVRYRRGSSIERAQLRWFAAALGLTVALLLLSVVLGDSPIGPLAWLGGILALSLIPVAIGIAIIRYRLYEIDRIISRTVSYAVVTGILALVFIGTILVSQTVLASFLRGSSVAVAASTLVVAALFQPLRRRVQSIVDRRFNRSRYDAERTVAAFAAHLRDEVALERLEADIRGVVSLTVAPTTVGLWMRTRGPRT